MHPLDAVGFGVDAIGCLFYNMWDAYAIVAMG